jgi:nicotinamidase/pyrazinamidase
MKAKKKVIFWNVDTQYDFMRKDGALPVPRAYEIEKDLGYLTKLAEEDRIQVVNTGDWHTLESKELSDKPNYHTTFPPHCLIGTEGAKFIPATKPKRPYIIDWRDKDFNPKRVAETRNIVLYKDAFDIFQGSPHADRVLEIIKPDIAIVYGVAADVCVNYAIHGLLDRGVEVYYFLDAIQGLHGTDWVSGIAEQWKKRGAEFLMSIGKNPSQGTVISLASYGGLGRLIEGFLEEKCLLEK